MSLLEEAKKIKTRNRQLELDQERIELALAYARREIRHNQLMAVLGLAKGSVHNFMATALASAIRQGICCKGNQHKGKGGA